MVTIDVTWRTRVRAALAVTMAAAIGLAHAQADGALWPSAGGNIANTRSQANESRIGVATVGRLDVKWVFSTGGDVSATPAVDGAKVYVPDWAGNLYAVDRRTGAQVWKVSIAAASGVPLDKARATPVIAGDKVIVGTQGSILAGQFGGPGGRMIAFDKDTGATRWVTLLDDHPAAIVTQSATVHGNRVLVGAASLEEALAGFIPGYPCCSFRGSMLALDVDTGKILWKTYMAPVGYSGNGVWGSSPAVDPKRGQVYVATGNNYSVPQAVLDCVAAAGNDASAKEACTALEPTNHFDSILALDIATGAVRWATRALPFDAWTVGCLPPPFGTGANCPDPEGPDYDFGQAPALFTIKTLGGKNLELVGAGQKSGQYWALNPDTGKVVWTTQAGPGGTGGGLQWGSAVDGQRVYTANTNSNFKPWTLPDATTTYTGVWSALDAATGAVLWQRGTPTTAANPVWGDTSGPVTVANGVVFSCSAGPSGGMYALNAATGAILWSYNNGASCLSGAAISNGQVFWGSGYSNFTGVGGDNRLFAFEIR